MRLHYISFANLFSFRSQQTLSFTVSANAPDTSSYLTSASGERFTKLMGVFGPNAAGKTNLLKLFGFAQHFICDSFSSDPKDRIAFTPHLWASREGEPSSIHVEFAFDDFVYRYAVEFTTHHVNHEELHVKQDVPGSRFSYLFKRKRIPESDTYEFKSRDLRLPPKFGRFVRGNASVISTAAQYEEPIARSICNAWERSCTNVTEQGRDDLIDGVSVGAMEVYKNHPDLLAAANDLLASFDLGLRAFTLREHEVLVEDRIGKTTVLLPWGIHKSAGEQSFELPFPLESSGTKNLFHYLSLILPALRNGSMVVMDEFEADLHPSMLETLLGLFTAEETNPLGSQLIFSSHYAPILGLLDKYQIALVEKNELGESEVWRLDEVKGVRADDNYFAKYVTGAYGGVPNL